MSANSHATHDMPLSASSAALTIKDPDTGAIEKAGQIRVSIPAAATDLVAAGFDLQRQVEAADRAYLQPLDGALLVSWAEGADPASAGFQIPPGVFWALEGKRAIRNLRMAGDAAPVNVTILLEG